MQLIPSIRNKIVQGLLLILQRYGTILSDGIPSVCVNNCKFKGAPQGYILEPVKFLIVINSTGNHQASQD